MYISIWFKKLKLSKREERQHSSTLKDLKKQKTIFMVSLGN